MRESKNKEFNNYTLPGLPNNDTELFETTHPVSNKGERVGETESIKISRPFLLQAPTIERSIENNLLSELVREEEEKEGYSLDRPKEDNVKITGLTKKVSSLDLSSFTFALGKILYDQSRTSRNTEYNTGLLPKEQAKTTDGRGYQGFIMTSLKEICKEAYGEKEPTSQQKKKMRSLIETIDRTPIVVEREGIRDESKLCVIFNQRKIKNGATYYQLAVNPLLCGELIKNNFGLFPHDASYRLTEAIRGRKGMKKTPQHFWLMNYLASQQTPHRIGIDNLLMRLNLTKRYKKNKTETLNILNDLFTIMKDIGLLRADLEKNPEIDYRKSDGMTLFIFHLNPEWSKNSSSNLLPD